MNIDKLTNDVLIILAGEHGKTSLSHLTTCLRNDFGWNTPKNESFFENLGFSVEYIYKKNTDIVRQTNIYL